MNNLERLFRLTLILVIVLMIGGCGGVSTASTDPEPTPAFSWNAAADSSSNALINNYWNTSSNYFNYGNFSSTEFQYWPNAHALDVMIDAYQRTGNAKYERYINDWFDGVLDQMNGSFINDFYDDMEWNALAMLRAYHETGDEKFRNRVLNLWTDIINGWSGVAGGGIMWTKSNPQGKNAISNAPASILASRLYKMTDEQDYLDWAKRIYSWQKETLVNPNNGAVWDNIQVQPDGSEEINKDWIFTYNQGVYLGAALELYNITGDRMYLNDAVQSADYTLNNLINSSDRILKDEGAGDGGLFKGIFVRYFTQLILEEDLPQSTRDRYVQFLEHNAETLWTEGTYKNSVLYDSYWKTKPGSNEQIDLTVQLSGSMLIEAAALLDNEGLIGDE